MKLNTYSIFDLPTKRAIEKLQRKITSMEAEIQSARDLIDSIKSNGVGGGSVVDLSDYAKTEDVKNLLVPYAKSKDVESELKSYATTEKVNSELTKKVDKVEGKGLSSNDYTTQEKEKLVGIEEGAQKNPTLYYCGIPSASGGTIYFEKIGHIVTVTYYSGNTISYDITTQNQDIASADYSVDAAYEKFLPKTGHQAILSGVAFFSGCSYAHAIINVFPRSNNIVVRINSILNKAGELFTGNITRLCFSGSYIGQD